jgi:hypothetical protein
VKDIVIIILGAACLLVSVLFMPVSEVGFGFDPKDLTTDSILAGPIKAMVDGPAGQAARPLGDWAKEHLAKHVDADDLKATLIGDYSYALVMGGAMVAAAIAIMLIGREEAEEKLVLPSKK